MIRSKKQYEELAAVKIVPVYKFELESKGKVEEEQLEDMVCGIAS